MTEPFDRGQFDRNERQGDQRCPRCAALVRAGSPWCTLCYADLRAPDPPPTAHFAPAARAEPIDPLTAPLALLEQAPPTAPDAAPAATPDAAPAAAYDTAAAAAYDTPTAGTAAAPSWPCQRCRAAVPLDADRCPSCGAGFLEGASDVDPVLRRLGGGLPKQAKMLIMVGGSLGLLALIMVLMYAGAAIF